MNTVYKIDTRNGLIYDANKESNISKYDLDFIRLSRIEYAKTLYNTGLKHIDIFQINPSGYSCAASCSYCANSSLCRNREEASSDFMTVDQLKEKINIIKSKTKISENIEIAFSGGDFVLNPYYDKLVETILNELDGNISFGWCMSGFHTQEDINKFIILCDKLENNSRVIRNTIYYTIDMDGSNYRASPVYNMTNDDTYVYANQLAKYFNDSNKTQIVITSKITDKANINIMKDNFDSFINNYSNIILRVGIVDGYYNVTPSIKQVADTFDMINKNYLTYYQSRGASTVMLVNKNNGFIKKKFGGYSLYLYELEDGIYACHPFDLYCWSYIRVLGIDNKGYFPCPFGFDHTENINDIIYPNMNKGGLFTELNNWINGDCKDCEYFGMCKLCKRVSCKRLPFRKEYMKQLINTIIKDPDTWLIVNNPFNIGYLKNNV